MENLQDIRSLLRRQEANAFTSAVTVFCYHHAEVPPLFHMPAPTPMLITLLNDGTQITIEYHIAVAPRTPKSGSGPLCAHAVPSRTTQGPA